MSDHHYTDDDRAGCREGQRTMTRRFKFRVMAGAHVVACVANLSVAGYAIDSGEPFMAVPVLFVSVCSLICVALALRVGER